MQVGALAARLGGRVVGDSGHRIDHVASLASAGPTSVAFLVNSALIEAANQSTAGVLLVDEHAAKALQSTAAASSPVSNLIVVDAPYVSFAQVARWLHPPLPLVAGTDAGANIDSRATLADSARVDANAVIGPGCVIADRVHIGAGCVLGANVEIGENSTLAPRVVVYDGCRIGQRCHVAAGAVLGKPGFGYHKHDGGWEHIPQLGGLRIGDDVDIGANTTIDRGTLDDTVIGNGVKLDNLIQIAHNVKIGDHTIMAAFVGVAGSATIGKRCMFGGRTSILGHIDIVDDVVVMATSFVGGHIDQPGEYSAALPVQKANVWRRNLARLRRLNKDAKPSR